MTRILWLALLCATACKRPASHAEQALPLLGQHCLPCHGAPGSPGAVPPALDSYEAAARVGEQITRVVQRREMPPFGADATGLCGRFRDARWLAPAEIAVLSTWPAQSPARIRASPRALPPRMHVEPALGPRTLSLDPGAWSPGLGDGLARCFAIDPHLEKDAVATAIALDRGAGIRQLSLFALDGADAARATKDGWACGPDAGRPSARLLAAWSWNVPTLRLPAATGVRLPAGAPLVLRLVHNAVASGASTAVHPVVQLELGQPPAEGRLEPLRATAFRLEPGRTRTTLTATRRIERPLLLHGVLPRMHARGVLLRARLLRAGREECLAYFGHWNPYDAQLFAYEAPLRLAPGDVVSLQCVLGTVGLADAAAEGLADGDEACAVHLYVTSPAP